MADITLNVDGYNDASAHRFLSLNAAIAHATSDHLDLSASTGFNGCLRIPISIGTEETLGVSVAGFLGADIDRFVDIYGVGNGLTTGVWSTGRYRLTKNVGNQFPLQISVPYTRVRGIQIGQLYAGSNGYSAVVIGAAAGVLMESCVIRGNTASTSWYGAVRCALVGAALTLRNCVIYGLAAGSGLSTYTSSSIVAQNCVIHFPNAGSGGVYRGGGTMNLVNCYVSAPTSLVGLGPYFTQTKVATSDALSSDVSLRNIAAAVGSGGCFTNVTAGTEDYTITSASPLRDVGNTLTDFTTDITGAQRTGVWDIGPFEILVAGQFAIPVSDLADGGWKRWTGTPLVEQDNVANYSALDETEPDDTDVVRSPVNPDNDTLTVGLSTVAPPAAGPVTLYVRARRVP